jgi:hypothetical protein
MALIVILFDTVSTSHTRFLSSTSHIRFSIWLLYHPSQPRCRQFKKLFTTTGVEKHSAVVKEHDTVVEEHDEDL